MTKTYEETYDRDDPGIFHVAVAERNDGSYLSAHQLVISLCQVPLYSSCYQMLLSEMASCQPVRTSNIRHKNIVKGLLFMNVIP